MRLFTTRLFTAKILALILLAAGISQAATYPIKNFLQIPYSFESSTGVSQRTPEIVSYYNNQKGKFPQKGDMVEITVPGVLSQMSYGSFFCAKMIANDAKLPPSNRWVHSQIDFNKRASDWSDAIYAGLFNEYSQIFWQRNLETDELDILKTEVRALRATFPNETASNQLFLTSVCSTFAGTFGFLLL